MPRADPVDLVDEQQRRHPQAAQRLHQPPGMGLHALDRGQHQHGTVQHPQRPLHLGDEVGVPGSVDEIDPQVADPEGGDGGLDGDPAAALDLAPVGLRGPGIHAPEPADDCRSRRADARSGWSYPRRHARGFRCSRWARLAASSKARSIGETEFSKRRRMPVPFLLDDAGGGPADVLLRRVALVGWGWQVIIGVLRGCGGGGLSGWGGCRGGVGADARSGCAAGGGCGWAVVLQAFSYGFAHGSMTSPVAQFGGAPSVALAADGFRGHDRAGPIAYAS